VPRAHIQLASFAEAAPDEKVLKKARWLHYGKVPQDSVSGFQTICADRSNCIKFDLHA
jgi:hypothetical protein